MFKYVSSIPHTTILPPFTTNMSPEDLVILQTNVEDFREIIDFNTMIACQAMNPSMSGKVLVNDIEGATVSTLHRLCPEIQEVVWTTDDPDVSLAASSLISLKGGGLKVVTGKNLQDHVWEQNVLQCMLISLNFTKSEKSTASHFIRMHEVAGKVSKGTIIRITIPRRNTSRQDMINAINDIVAARGFSLVWMRVFDKIGHFLCHGDCVSCLMCT